MTEEVVGRPGQIRDLGDKLRLNSPPQARGPGESYSGVIIRVARVRGTVQAGLPGRPFHLGGIGGVPLLITAI